MAGITSYTSPLTPEQVPLLKELLVRENFSFKEKPYTHYAAAKGKLNISVYEKGPKVLIQGKETQDFVQFHLEPEILGEARLGYEEELNPEMFAPHFGIDESGKGDFFGPLVIAGVYVDKGIARHLIDQGIQDSKRITSDTKIRTLAKIIRTTPTIALEVVELPPEAYNRLYNKIGNLNRLLAWGHARTIENLCKRVPLCPRALSDQFANAHVLESALLEKGRSITLEQKTKGESDVAVAAASILAREKFIDWMDAKSKELDQAIPRGASAQVKATAAKLVETRGPDFLHEIGKTHFNFAKDLIF